MAQGGASPFPALGLHANQRVRVLPHHCKDVLRGRKWGAATRSHLIRDRGERWGDRQSGDSAQLQSGRDCRKMRGCLGELRRA